MNHPISNGISNEINNSEGDAINNEAGLRLKFVEAHEIDIWWPRSEALVAKGLRRSQGGDEYCAGKRNAG